MTDYEGIQAYLATNLLLKNICSSAKLFGHLHGEDLHLAKDDTNSCYMHAIGIPHEPDIQSLDTLDLEPHRPCRRSYRFQLLEDLGKGLEVACKLEARSSSVNYEQLELIIV